MVRGERDIDEKLARIFAAMQKWNFLQLKAAQDRLQSQKTIQRIVWK